MYIVQHNSCQVLGKRRFTANLSWVFVFFLQNMPAWNRIVSAGYGLCRWTGMLLKVTVYGLHLIGERIIQLWHIDVHLKLSQHT